jgi:hypothetical protein
MGGPLRGSLSWKFKFKGGSKNSFFEQKETKRTKNILKSEQA